MKRLLTISRFYSPTGLFSVTGLSCVIGLLSLSVIAILMSLGGCATTGVNIGDFNLVSSPQEVQMGDSLSLEVESKYPMLKNETVGAYVNEVGQRIVSVCDRRDIPYYFKVVADKKQVNAFALPGGHIYVYEGLLLEASNEAQLAAVLAHEVGHVVARHAAKQLTKQYGYSLLVSLILGNQPGRWSGLAADLFGTPAAGRLVGSGACSGESDRAVRRGTRTATATRGRSSRAHRPVSAASRGARPLRPRPRCARGRRA